MDQEEKDLRSQLFPQYKKTGASAPAPAPAPAPVSTPTPVSPTPPPVAPVPPPVSNQKLGSTFVFTPFATDDPPEGHFWRLFFVNFLLFIASLSVTFVNSDSPLGLIVFLFLNPISYFILAMIISILVGYMYHRKGDNRSASHCFTFAKSLLVLGILVTIIFVILGVAFL